jgi:hypothetical protein
MGMVAKAEGNVAEAERLFREALLILEKLKSPHSETVRRDLDRVQGKRS